MNGLDLPGQLWRLGQFRARNPSVVIRRDTRLDFWQAWIPAGSGGTVITRYLLQELLDKLEELVGPERSHGSGDLGTPGYSTGPGTDGQDRGR